MYIHAITFNVHRTVIGCQASLSVQVILLLCITHQGRGGAAVAGLPSGGAVQAEAACRDLQRLQAGDCRQPLRTAGGRLQHLFSLSHQRGSRACGVYRSV